MVVAGGVVERRPRLYSVTALKRTKLHSTAACPKNTFQRLSLIFRSRWANSSLCPGSTSVQLRARNRCAQESRSRPAHRARIRLRESMVTRGKRARNAYAFTHLNMSLARGPGGARPEQAATADQRANGHAKVGIRMNAGYSETLETTNEFAQIKF